MSGSNVRATTTGVNLRAGPSAQTPKLATLPKGARVNLLSCAASWCRVTWQGKTGYVAQTYLRR
ncbi:MULTISPECIES: SH3 domain-containing protein [Deinococcus]|uniref:SH3 domain-containing protein n=1 Tax=Deinococcus TaxID=1298 RepID=UPI0013045035|nr:MULTISPECIES: SH3 domain-containing protein [Deinococcus]